MLDIKQGDDVTLGRPWNRDGQRIVEHVDIAQQGAKRRGTQGRLRHRPKARRRRCRARVRVCHDRREPAAGVGRERRCENEILVRADARERPSELSGIGLAPAGDPRNEGEQGESDAHGEASYSGG